MKSSAKRLLSLVIVLAMALSMLPVFTFAADATTTVYCQAPDSWSTCKVYWWMPAGSTASTEPDEGPAAPTPWSSRAVEVPSWPGVDMQKDANGIWYYDVPSDAAGVIFNNGSGIQTGDLSVPKDNKVMFVFSNNEWKEYGKVIVTANYYVAGQAALCGVDWSPNAAANKMTDDNQDGIYTITYTGVAAGNYEFKVTSGSWAESWGDDKGGNYALKVTEDNSTVTINFDASTCKISVVLNNATVTEPSTEAPVAGYYVAGNMNLWNECDPAYIMTAQADGTYTLTFAVTASAEPYELKVTDGSWSNCWPGDNYVFTAVADGDVTVTFNPSDCSVNVTGKCLENESTETLPTEPVATNFYVAGSMNNWTNPDVAYLMDAQADGTYAITFQVTAGEQQLKVTDGTWTNSWGDNGGNYVFKATTDGTVTVTFDPSSCLVTVTGDCLGEKEPLLINTVHAVGATGLTGFEWAVTENVMTNNGGVYTITFENVSAGTYEYKFAANGAWDLNWAAGVETVPGETYTAWKNAMGNSSVTVAENGSNVTLILDLTAMDAYTGEGGVCSVEITTKSAEMTPAEIVDAAYALAGGESLEGTYTLTGKIISIDTAYNATYGNITVSMVVEGKEDMPIQCYRLAGEGADTLAKGDTITVTGILMNYEKTNSETGEVTNTIEFTQGCTLDAVEKPVIVVPSDPKEIVDAAYELAVGEELPYKATLTGKVTAIDSPYSAQYKNVSIVIAIEGKEDKPILCYRVKGEGADVVKVGDTVTVTGTIKNYNGTIEFVSGCTLDSLIPGDGEEIVIPDDQKEIVDAAYALAGGAALPYEATLTGKVTEIVDPYSEDYKNITFNIVVAGREDKPVMIYRIKGEGVETLAVGDTVTVTGTLKNYVKTDSETGVTTSTIELVSGTLVEIVAGEPITGVTVSGKIKSYGDASAAVTVELWIDGAAAYTLTTTDGTYAFENVALGEYTMKISKVSHVTREVAVTVDADVALAEVKIQLVGDVTGDGRVNVADTSKVYAHVKGTSLLTDYAFECADVDGNGRINVADTSKVYSHVKGTKPLW